MRVIFLSFGIICVILKTCPCSASHFSFLFFFIGSSGCFIFLAEPIQKSSK